MALDPTHPPSPPVPPFGAATGAASGGVPLADAATVAADALALLAPLAPGGSLAVELATTPAAPAATGERWETFSEWWARTRTAGKTTP